MPLYVWEAAFPHNDAATINVVSLAIEATSLRQARRIAQQAVDRAEPTERDYLSRLIAEGEPASFPSYRYLRAEISCNENNEFPR